MVMEAKTVGSPPASGMEQTVDGGEPDKLIMGLAAEEFEWQDRLRLVPYRGVNRGRFHACVKARHGTDRTGRI